MTTIGDYVRVGALTAPRHPALVSVPEKKIVSYRELDDRSDRLAAAAIAHGLRPGDRIGCWMTTSVAYVEIYLAAAKAGLVIVPVNERYTVAEATHIVQDADIRAIFFDPGQASAAAELPLAGDAWRVCSGAAPGGVTPLEELYKSGVSTRLPAVAREAVFGIVYTSGTTGVPKGAMLTHASVMATHQANAVAYRLVVRGTAVYGASMSFTGTVLGQLLAHLYTGSTIIMTGATEPEAILRAAQTYDANFAGVPPPLIPEFTEALTRSRAGLPMLRSLLQSGGRVPPDSIARLNELLTGRLVLAWGMTEISGGAAAASTEADMRAALAGDTRILASVGRPVPGCVVQTSPLPQLDADHVEDTHELRIRSDALMSGYWNLPGETMRAIRDGWYYSGDLGTVDEDGYVYIVDRRTDLIVSGGANVYPSEVENVIAAMPEVQDCAAVGLPHPRWGQSVTAIIVVRPGARLHPQDVLDYCRARLAGYKKPTAVLLASGLPRTASGKIQRSLIRDRAAAGEYELGYTSGKTKAC